jgi:hypothetical protein
MDVRADDDLDPVALHGRDMNRVARGQPGVSIQQFACLAEIRTSLG